MAQTWPDGARSERVALAWLCVSGVAMLAFVAVGPSIIRNLGYGVFIPALAASGLLTLIAARLAGEVRPRAGLIVILGLALAMRLLLVGEPGAVPLDRHLSLHLGRPRPGRRHQSLSLRPGRSGARGATRCRDLSAYQPRRLRGHRLSTGRRDVLPRRDAHRREPHRDAPRDGRLRGRDRAGHHRSRAAAGAPGHRGRCLCVAPAGDLGDRQQRPRRGADGRAADAGRLAAGAVACRTRRGRDRARRAGEALCGAGAAGVLAALGLARAARRDRDGRSLLSALCGRRTRRVRLRGGLRLRGRARERLRHLARVVRAGAASARNRFSSRSISRSPLL